MSAVGRRYFGKTPVTVDGREVWDRHDATKTWSDGGETAKIVAGHMTAMQTELETTVAQNAVLAVSEFASSAEAAIRADGDDVIVGIRFYSDASALIVNVPLRQILAAALSEIRPLLGADPNAQAALSNLVAIGRQLAQIGNPSANHNSTGPHPMSAPARPSARRTAS